MKIRFLKFLIISCTFLTLSSLDVSALTTREIILLGRKVDPKKIKKEKRAEQKKEEKQQKSKNQEEKKKSLVNILPNPSNVEKP